MSDNPFGEVIYSYTRQQAIDDGVLVDITPLASRLHLVPTVITQGVHEVLMRGVEGNSETAWIDRANEILQAMIKAPRKSGRVDFNVFDTDMYALAHGDDNNKTCITIMLIGED